MGQALSVEQRAEVVAETLRVEAKLLDALRMLRGLPGAQLYTLDMAEGRFRQAFQGLRLAILWPDGGE